MLFNSNEYEALKYEQTWPQSIPLQLQAQTNMVDLGHGVGDWGHFLE